MFCLFLGEIAFAGRWRVGQINISQANANHPRNQVRARADKRISTCHISQYR